MTDTTKTEMQRAVETPFGQLKTRKKSSPSTPKHDSLCITISGLSSCWCKCAKCWDPQSRRCVCTDCRCWR